MTAAARPIWRKTHAETERLPARTLRDELRALCAQADPAPRTAP